MKIGLLTVYSFNYGSFIQATALYKQLEELGYETVFINEKFKKNRWFNLFLLYTFDAVMPSFVKPLISKVLPQYETFLKLKRDVKRFKETDARLHDMSRITSELDLVVLGADEMWSANKKSIRYMPEHFGYRIKCPHISYATCGALFDLNDKELCQNASKGLKTFDSILVRDTYTKGVVKRLINSEVKVVLDPALLNPYYVEKADSDKKYVLLYGQHYSDEQIAFIKKTATELKAKIYALGWPQNFADSFVNPDSVKEFMKVFANSSFCFPSTFHGTIFSIVHHKPFISMTNELRGKKVVMLLKQLGLSSRIYCKDMNEIEEIDYDKVEERLGILREESLELLKQSLGKYKKEDESEICDRNECIGCMACKNVCRFDAIKEKKGADGFAYPVIDKEKCKNCGLCRSVCPNIAKQPLKSVDSVYAYQSCSEAERQEVASGGAFYNLSRSFVQKGGIVYGAAFDRKFCVSHIRADSAMALERLKGSKYVESRLGDTYKLISEDLKQGNKVLFSGTPCQVAGLYAYLGNDHAGLYTIDIFCHGVPSPLLLKKYLEYLSIEHGSMLRKLNFKYRIKGIRNHSFYAEFENGEKHIKYINDEPFYVMYFSNIALRNSCYNCKYASFKRIGNMSLGDYLGAAGLKNKSFDDIEGGINCIFVNDAKGKKLLDLLDKKKLVKGDLKTAYQPILEAPSKKNCLRNKFFTDLNKQSMEYMIKKYGSWSLKSRFIKKIVVPVLRKIGLEALVQKLVFRNKK